MRRKLPVFFGLHAKLPRGLGIVLALLPFALLVIVYLTASDIRQKANPQDKLLPPVSKIAKALEKSAFTLDKRSGVILLWQDTASSLRRLGIGMMVSACLGFLMGLNMGLLPGIRGLSLSFVTFISNIPPLAILPILFISFGVGEVGKVMLIILGTFPLITRDIYLAAKRIPKENIVKALTLGASQFGVVYRVVFPQVIPRLIDTVRLSLGAAWLFLIASEAIASQDGLGYRIFLVRRYLSMDMIIVYVAWITFLAFLADLGLRKLVAVRYPWYSPRAEG
ncbi:MAG: ABC transporter permease subunit [Desulfobacteraceae bacterium]|nr:ABC transporter permease subunit [Desulfobacteraceae bacterium]